MEAVSPYSLEYFVVAPILKRLSLLGRLDRSKVALGDLGSGSLVAKEANTLMLMNPKTGLLTEPATQNSARRPIGAVQERQGQGGFAVLAQSTSSA